MLQHLLRRLAARTRGRRVALLVRGRTRITDEGDHLTPVLNGYRLRGHDDAITLDEHARLIFEPFLGRRFAIPQPRPRAMERAARIPRLLDDTARGQFPRLIQDLQ